MKTNKQINNLTAHDLITIEMALEKYLDNTTSEKLRDAIQGTLNRVTDIANIEIVNK